jgi:hypothetical protein
MIRSPVCAVRRIAGLQIDNVSNGCPPTDGGAHGAPPLSDVNLYMYVRKSTLGRSERLLIKTFTISSSLKLEAVSDSSCREFSPGTCERAERLTLLFWQAICAKR